MLLSCEEQSPENQAPVCEIILPSQNELFDRGDTVSISIEANDIDGYIKEIRLYIDSAGIIALSQFPYKYEWMTQEYLPGKHIIEAIAEDDKGIESKDSVVIIIDYELPIIKTIEASDITDSSAIISGEIEYDGWGTIIEKGFYWGTSQDLLSTGKRVIVYNDSSHFNYKLPGLNQTTTYYYMAFAKNEKGENRGDIVEFTTKHTVILPQISFGIGDAIIDSTSFSGHYHIFDGWGTILETGYYLSNQPNAQLSGNKTTLGNRGSGWYNISIIDLEGDSEYYIVAFATNSVGTVFSQEESFKTDPSKLIDIDGNIYKIVKIDGILWMQENLRVTHYRNGDPIPHMDSVNWESITNDAYCYYNDNDSLQNIYGNLYNSNVLINSSSVCPEGWHVPTYQEWFDFFRDDAGAMKETGTEHWKYPNELATNSTGFTALPGGCSVEGNYGGIGKDAWFHSSTLTEGENMFLRLRYNDGKVRSARYPLTPDICYSIRCIKDYAP